MTTTQDSPSETNGYENITQHHHLYVLALSDAMTEQMVEEDIPDWRHANNGLYKASLSDAIQAIDGDPFPFAETWDGYKGFMGILERLGAENLIGRVRDRERIALTERGQQEATKLYQVATDDQEAAIREAVAAAVNED
ncbi:hypothetical protein [Halobacterium rubrum]|uniref:hypothetical protein n=1 Tax=Halobacterium TaxID=2239 RepID=UPI001F3AFD7F|nr:MULTISPECIES: hypothetical protein [Halobacterium]MDH5021695.1 hypothetical protein [Halobacterium rubrum]